MNTTNFTCPILFLVFNRPDTTKKIFEAIKAISPKILYIAADGPRINIPSDDVSCNSVRAIIEEGIDWDCEVKTLFRKENLGCGKAVQSALDWFFEQEEFGIILEDDTLPNMDFFEYCSVMLDKYRYNYDIFSINGCSLGYQSNKSEYGITNYFNMWGWASWRRSNNLVKIIWKEYLIHKDILNDKELIIALRLNTIWGLNNWYLLWQSLFFQTGNSLIDTWDYQWIYTALKTKSKCIRPSNNYIVNIGYGEMATHTTISDHYLATLKFSNTKFSSTQFGALKIDEYYEKFYVAEIWNDYKTFRRSSFYNSVYKYILFIKRIIFN